MAAMTSVFWVSLAVLLYVHVGYPLVLQLIVSLRGRRAVGQGGDLPSVTLVISAYNEAAVIAAKLENAIALSYPRDRLQIVVVSDASTDATDDIVRGFAPFVELVALTSRRGKTAGLNLVVPTLRGEIVVFSDANAMYEPDALRMIVRNFADTAVGCVTGEARYTRGAGSAADAGERAYWGYEIWIKRLETAVGSMVGGDGAIYGIRRSLWRELPMNAINDFLNPLQIVTAGYRAIYEPAAVCYEETAGRVGREWRRRVRIVSRSWRAVFQSGGALNPFKTGTFAFCLMSHKVLRWFSGVFLAGVFVPLTLIGYGVARTLHAGLVLFLVALGLSGLASRRGRRSVAFVFYFGAISLASVVGILKGTIGNVSGVWAPPRSHAHTRIFRPGAAVLVAAAICIPGAAVALATVGAAAAPWVFWSAVGVVAYVYAGYGLVLRLASAVAHEPVNARPIAPHVCLLITAHDEAAVICQKIENCLTLDYPRELLDVVVASDGSTDATAALARSFFDRGVQVVAFPIRRGKIACINDAIRSVTADIVVFSDANTFLRRDALQMLVRNFADPRVGAVSGDVVLVGERASLAGSEDLYYRYERALQRVESSLGSLIGVDGALYAIRRNLFVPPPADTILDDMAIPMAVVRAGLRVVFEEAAFADEEGSASASEEFSRKSRVIAGAVQFLLRTDSALPVRPLQPIVTLVSHKALRWMSPAFAALAFAASVQMAHDSSVFAAIVTLQLAVLGAGLVGCIPRLRRFGAIGLSHYLCLVQCAAAIGILRGLTGRQPVAWRRFARARAHVV